MTENWTQQSQNVICVIDFTESFRDLHLMRDFNKIYSQMKTYRQGYWQLLAALAEKTGTLAGF